MTTFTATLTAISQDAIWEELANILDALGVEDPATTLRGDPLVSFEAIDVDSLGVIETAAHLDDVFGCNVTDTDLSAIRRPIDFVQLLTGQDN